MASRLLALIWLIVWGAAVAPALAQQTPPQEPILRIDAVMHTALIGRIGVDAACTLLATGSHDKTVRLWRLPEGKLLRTLRPPIGVGNNNGKVSAVALAPDGSWVAAGAWDATSTEYSAMGAPHFCLYISGLYGRAGRSARPPAE